MKMTIYSFLLVLFLSFTKCQRPVILTVSVPIYKQNILGEYNNSMGERVQVSLAKWLDQSGADLIAVHTFTPKDEIDALLHKVSGIVFQGYDRSFDPGSPYYDTVSYIIRECFIKHGDSKGERSIPIYAFGNDLALLAAILTKDLSIVKSYRQIVSGQVRIKYKRSKNSILFKEFTEEDLASLDFLHLTPFDINFVVSTYIFKRHPILTDIFKYLGKTHGFFGGNVVAAFEGVTYPFLGTLGLYHEIKFVDPNKRDIPIGEKAELFSKRIGDAFVRLCSKSGGTPLDLEEKMKSGFIDLEHNHNYSEYGGREVVIFSIPKKVTKKQPVKPKQIKKKEPNKEAKKKEPNKDDQEKPNPEAKKEAKAYT